MIDTKPAEGLPYEPMDEVIYKTSTGISYIPLVRYEELRTAALSIIAARDAEIKRLKQRIKQMERDANEDARGAADEARWKERQGDDYGSY